MPEPLAEDYRPQSTTRPGNSRYQVLVDNLGRWYEYSNDEIGRLGPDSFRNSAHSFAGSKGLKCQTELVRLQHGQVAMRIRYIHRTKESKG